MDRIEPATRIQPHAQRRAGSQALERLGDRFEAYRGVGQHVLLVGGTRSPGHFGDRIELLHRVPPSSDIRRMEGAGHTGPIRKAGDLVALLLADIATHVSVQRPNSASRARTAAMGDEPQCACAPSSWSRRSARSGLPGAARLWERPAVPGPAVESRPPPPVGRYDAGEGDLLLSAGGVWRLNLRGGADVHVTLDGRERRGHAVLVEDPDQAAEEFAALLNRVGPRPLGVKLHVARAPTTAEVKAALGGRGVAHLRLTD